MKKALVVVALTIILNPTAFTQRRNAAQTNQTSVKLTDQVDKWFAQAPVACAPGEALSGDLGFTGTECHGCMISGKHIVGEPDIEFDAEPVLSGIRKGGPADGKLEEGDVLVAIDGQLITTRAAAVHLSWLKPGEPVRLTVRRNRVITDVEITPAARCRRVTDAPPLIIVGRKAPGQRGRLSAISPDARGWIGVGLSCGACGLSLDPQTRMSFRTFPEVVQVIPDSPAAEAGLKAGDVLIAIDGVSLKTQTGASLFRDIKPNQRVTILLIRGAETVTLTLTAGAAR